MCVCVFAKARDQAMAEIVALPFMGLPPFWPPSVYISMKMG